MRNSDHPSLPYRSDIDGLRAIAVIAVVLFHADFAFAKGGFIGVDVFFVISGFLITSILTRELPAGLDGLGRFYERRARRIIPAITVMLVAVGIAGFLMFPPNQLIQTAKALLATIVFGANFFFWQTSSYFGPEAALNPLTHMWSLGVEEQFYVFFPICLWLVLQCPRRFRSAAVICAAIFSWGLGYWLSFNHPPSAFYMLPARAWELLIGSSLALANLRWPSRIASRQLMGFVGILLVGIGFAVIDDKTKYPGFHALLPVMGTAALLAAGGGAASTVTRLLSCPFLVAVGLRSYSIYLWHWPVLVGTKAYLGEFNLNAGQVAVAILIGLLCAEFSYRLIERPFRNKSRITLPTMAYGLTGISIGLAAWSVAAVWQHGMVWRFSPEVIQLDADAGAYSSKALACFSNSRFESFGNVETCRLGAAQEKFSFVLWGDSHAGAIAPAIASLATAHRKSGYLAAMSSCPPFLALHTGVRDQNTMTCEHNNRYVLNAIMASRDVDTVFLFASWQRYHDEAPAKMVAGIKALAKALKQSGKTVVLIHGMPRPDMPVPWTLARKIAANQDAPSSPRPFEPWLKATKAKTDIVTADLSEALCDDQKCALTKNGRALYVDSSHLSQPANDLVIAPWLYSKFTNWPEPRALR